MKNKIALLLICICAISCKDAKTTTESADTAIVGNDFFELNLNLTVQKDDNFHLYYTEDGSLSFNEESSIWQAAKGDASPQNIKFQIPANVSPTALRLDLGYGSNQHQQAIDIHSIKISYFDQKLEMNGAEIFNYFYITPESGKRSNAAAKVERITRTQISGVIMYPNENLIQKLQEMKTKSGM